MICTRGCLNRIVRSCIRMSWGFIVNGVGRRCRRGGVCHRICWNTCRWFWSLSKISSMEWSLISLMSPNLIRRSSLEYHRLPQYCLSDWLWPWRSRSYVPSPPWWAWSYSVPTLGTSLFHPRTLPQSSCLRSFLKMVAIRHTLLTRRLRTFSRRTFSCCRSRIIAHDRRSRLLRSNCLMVIKTCL